MIKLLRRLLLRLDADWSAISLWVIATAGTAIPLEGDLSEPLRVSSAVSLLLLTGVWAYQRLARGAACGIVLIEGERVAARVMAESVVTDSANCRAYPIYGYFYVTTARLLFLFGSERVSLPLTSVENVAHSRHGLVVRTRRSTFRFVVRHPALLATVIKGVQDTHR